MYIYICVYERIQPGCESSWKTWYSSGMGDMDNNYITINTQMVHLSRTPGPLAYRRASRGPAAGHGEGGCRGGMRPMGLCTQAWYACHGLIGLCMYKYYI